MKILQLCNKMPWPATDGYAIAVLNLARAFAASGSEVHVLAMNTTRHRVDLKTIPPSLLNSISLETVDVDNSISAADAFLKLVQNRSYNVSRFISKEYSEQLLQTLKKKKFDIIQLEGLYLTPYIDLIRKHSDAKIVLRAHNVEHVVWERNSKVEKNPAKKIYLSILAKQLKKYETSVLNKIDLLIPVTKIDGYIFKELGCIAPQHVCPVSFDDVIIAQEAVPVEQDSLFFIGTLDWKPNSEGLDWFLQNVWDKLAAEFPQLKLYIAGRNMSVELKDLKKKNIFPMGEVPDAYAFIRARQIMIVPLFSGSGMRVKIVEGMALGKLIVSTTIGAEGIACTDGKDILIADNETEFIEQLSAVIMDRSKADTIAKNARTFALSHYSASSTAKELIEFYQNKLA